MSQDYSLNIDTVSTVRLNDRSWMANNFMLPIDLINGSDKNLRILTRYSSVMGKVWDTTLGGHLAINCPPQNNPLADIRGGILTASDVEENGFIGNGGEYSTGLGRYFSESIEDNMETITFQPGHLRYQGVIPFFTNFYDADQASLSKSGHGPSIFFRAGQVAGTAATIAAMFISTPLAMVICGGAAIRFFLNRPSSGYYYIKPSPWAYWRRAQFILNQLSVYLKLTPIRGQWGGSFWEDGKFDESQAGDTEEFLRYANAMMPNVFRPEGGIDIIHTALRGARLDRLRRQKLQGYLETLNKDNTVSAMRDMMTARFEDDPSANMETYTELYFRSHFGNMDYMQFDPFNAIVQERGAQAGTVPAAPKNDTQTDTAIASEANQTSEAIGDTLDKDLPDRMRTRWVKDSNGTALRDDESGWSLSNSWVGDAVDYATQTAKKGADFVTFKVDPIGTISESFTNTLGESEIGSKINSTSSSAASARFSVSGGNTGVDVVDGAFIAVGDFLKGFLSGVHMDGLLALAGSANVEIPKHYQNSSSDFQNHTFNIELRSPYGDRMSQFFNLYVPLACLLALALPLSTGLQSYSAPFYCMGYSKGRCMIRNGMVTSLSITRGVGNQGWNKRMEPLGIDVSLTLTDAAQVMHAPIDPGLNLLKPWKIAFDDDSAFKDYLSSMASMSLVDMTDPVRKAGINLAKFQLEWGSLFSASNIGMWAGDSTIPRLFAQASRIFSGQPSEIQLRGGPSPQEVLKGGGN